MKILWLFLFIVLSLSTRVSCRKEKALKRLKRHYKHAENEIDLRRTKRNIYQALLKKKFKEKRNVLEDGVDLDERSLIRSPPNAKRAYKKEHVQDVQARIEVIHEWREEMVNKTSPEYKLLAGNIIDAITNEFVANLNFISAGVSKLTKTKSKRKIIADVVFRFYKSEDDPVLHIQSIIGKGWISGQQVDPNYFKLQGVKNGNHQKPKWHYPEGVELRVIPAKISKENASSSETGEKYRETEKQTYTTYKEIHISIKLKQRYQMFLEDSDSPEFSELSGNVEQAIDKIFTNDWLFIESHVLAFRESEEGRVIVYCALKFHIQEKYAIEKCQAMISGGDLAGMPVDEQYFIVNSVAETNDRNNQTAPVAQYEQSIPQNIPQPEPMKKKFKPKPLQYKEVRASIKFNEPWNSSFNSNETRAYSIFSGMVEQAIDRGLTDNPNYIDASVIDFLESYDHTTIANIAVRFQLTEEDPEYQTKNLIQNGSLSKLPVDNSFFYVFAISETNHPDQTEQIKHNETNNESASLLVSEHVSQPTKQTKGQKQPAEYKPKILSEIQDLRPSVIGMSNETEKLASTQAPVTSSGSSTFNPYLPVQSAKETNKQPTSQNPSTPVFTDHETSTSSNPNTNSYPIQKPDTPKNSYLDTSQGTVNNNGQGNYPWYNYPYANAQQSWYPLQPYTQQENVPVPTTNPYLPNELAATGSNNVSPPPLKESNYTSSPSANDNTSSEAISTENRTSTQPMEESNEDIEGSMTLEQSWHPQMSDKSSIAYKVLEQTVTTAIKYVYSQVDENVNPVILGFSETDIPVTSMSVSNEKKVGVRFKISFMPNHNATSKPLADAVQKNSVAGITIYQNSLVIAESTINNQQNGKTVTGKQLTICQKQQKYAESATDGPIGTFVPQCNGNGGYKAVQCHALTGFCWCVNEQGVRITGTEERYKQPNCEGIKVSGKVRLPEHNENTLLPGSCLSIFIQEMKLCGGEINCHIPVIANQTFNNVSLQENSISYELTTTKLKPGEYVMTGVVNNGWCRVNSLKTSEQIRTGDYHTTIMHTFNVEPETKNIERDINVELLKPEETGIILHGIIILPDSDQLASIPKGSCLSIQTKSLVLCTGPKCPPIPTNGNETIRDLQIINQTIPYRVQLPELDPGTYVLSAVLHVGQCPENDQSMVSGDYYNDEMHDYTVTTETVEVEKDINLVKLKDDQKDGISVSGRIILPEDLELPPGSCLSVSSRKLIQCKNNNCKIPPVSTKTFKNVTNNAGIPYSLILPVATPGTYIISAVVNVGWCKADDGKEWIRPGDFYNDKIHDFEIKNDTTTLGKNILAIPYATDEHKTGVTVHGRVILPPDADVRFPSNSCLTIRAQEFKLCGGTINCVNPITAKDTYHEPQLEDHVIPYALVLPNVAFGHYIISAVLNVGWCKESEEDDSEWILSGDYHNVELSDFIVSVGMDQVEKDIELSQYVETMTGPPYNNDQTENAMTETRPTEVSTPPSPSSTLLPTGEDNNVNGTSIPEAPLNQNATTLLSVEKMIHTTPVPTLPRSSNVLTATANVPVKQDVGEKSPQEEDLMRENVEVQLTTTGVPTVKNIADDIITLPAGLPKSCQEIKDAGIGNMDGQYIIEARLGCHLSIICQGMDQASPKEFLGGPSEEEWKYWHYAVLIKISEQDKQNIPTGACLERSEVGRDLLKRVLAAGAQQGNPISDWRTNLNELLRSKRNLPNGDSLITKAKTIYKGEKQMSPELESEWGVL